MANSMPKIYPSIFNKLCTKIILVFTNFVNSAQFLIAIGLFLFGGNSINKEKPDTGDLSAGFVVALRKDEKKRGLDLY